MCGRLEVVDVDETFRLRRVPLLTEMTALFSVRANVAPTDVVPVIVGPDEPPRSMSWGFQRSWTRRPLFNARADKLDAATWAAGLANGRGVVMAGGFYEWSGVKGSRVCWRIRRTDGQPLLLAGLWEEPGFATVVTTEPNAMMAAIHDRMPVVLDGESALTWLESGERGLLVPCPEGALMAEGVTGPGGAKREAPPETSIRPGPTLWDGADESGDGG